MSAEEAIERELDADLAGRINPERSRHFSQEQFLASHEQLQRSARALWPRPPDRLRVAVVGSNGKGSTALALEGMLRAAGHPTGLFTSPHLLHVCERIRLDGVPVSPARLLAAIRSLEARRPETASYSYFEILSLAAIALFREERCAEIYEAGLGGRLDATRVAAPTVVILTALELEHTAVLGSTIEAIAGEKLGMIGRESQLLLCMQQKRLDEGQLYKLGLAAGPVRIEVYPERPNFARESYVDFNRRFAEFCLQRIHAARLGPPTLTERVGQPSIAPRLRGRMEQRPEQRSERFPEEAGGHGMQLVFDTAHNLPGLTIALAALATRAGFPGFERTAAVFARLADRPAEEFSGTLAAAGFAAVLEYHLDETVPPDVAADVTLRTHLERWRSQGIQWVFFCGSHRLYVAFDRLAS